MTVELSDEDGNPDPSRPRAPLARRDHAQVREQEVASPAQAHPARRQPAAPTLCPLPARSSARRSSSSPTTPRPCSRFGPCSSSTRLAPMPSPPGLSANDGTLVRQDRRGGDYDYEVISDADQNAPQPSELPPAETDESLLKIPGTLRSGCARSPSPSSPGFTAEGQDGDRGPRAGTRAISARFRASSATPSQMDVVDRSARPGRRLSREPQERTLRVLRQRAGPLAAVHRHSVAGRQRLQRGRLERVDRNDQRPPETRP